MMTVPSINTYGPVGIRIMIMCLAYACRQTVGTAVLRSCNYIRPTSSVKLLKRTPTQNTFWRLTNLKSFPFPIFVPFIPAACVASVILDLWSVCALCMTRITKHNFVWQFYLLFRISMQSLLNWSVSLSKFSVVSVAMSFPVNYFLWEFIKYWGNHDVKHPSGFTKL